MAPNSELGDMVVENTLLRNRMNDAFVLNAALINKIEDLEEKIGKLQENNALHVHDISDELWREYEYGGRIYRIVSPRTLYFYSQGTTHRVLDAFNIVHCVPAPGRFGCALRWSPKDPKKPVQF